MDEKLLRQAAQKIIKTELGQEIKLGELPVHLSVYPKGNELIVELRKRWKIDLQKPATNQAVYVKKLLTAVFSGKPVIAEIKIECVDEFQTKTKLKTFHLL